MAGGGRKASRSLSSNSAKPGSSSKQAQSTPGLVPQTIRISRYLFTRDHEVLTRHDLPDHLFIQRLTSRDIAMLMALDQYRYLDRQQIEHLFFHGPRSCQLRLKHLTEYSLLLRWQVRLQPGYVPRPSIYVLSSRGARLLARVCQADRESFVRRAEHARSHAFHLLHDLEANAFFVGLATAGRARNDEGLYHWVGERGAWHAYAQARELGPIPDGWGRYLLPEGEVIFFLEWDRGTLQRARLRMKVSHYRNYFRGRRRATATHVLYVVPTQAREEQVRTEIGRALFRVGSDCCRFWTTTVERLHRDGPLGRIWWAAGAPERFVQFEELPMQPPSGRPATACIGKPYWWERRPAGGQGA